MAIPFYYNPATNELELTADPSPLRPSLGERFGLNKISTARKTLSPTKSYTEGGRTGFDAGTLVAEEVSVKPSKLKEVAKKYVGKPFTKLIAGATLPGTQIIPETVKAVKEKRLPNYNLTDPQTWVNAAFWNWAVKEWGFDKTVKNFGESLKHLSKGDKARVFRNVVARAGLSPKALQVIGSRVAWPVAGAMSIYDAYKDYKRTDAAIKKRWEEDPEGMKKSEEKIREWINTDPSFKGGMFAKGGRIGVKKK